MQAIVHTQYGSPDVLQLQTVAQPIPDAGEVLVQVHAVAANPLDWHLMRGAPFLARFDNGLFKPKKNILGADIAGVVAAVGRDVTRFQPGDAVFGELSSSGLGGFAEYACAPEAMLVPKPTNLSFAQAAAVPVAALTALQGLRDKGQIRAGQKVLINGASGGVGTFAVQIAKFYGAEVTGICSTRNLELVRGIGADHVIDYTQADFTRGPQQYDLIFDAIANYRAGEIRRVLTPQGKGVLVGFSTMSHMVGFLLAGAWISRGSDLEIGMMGTATPNQPDLSLLQELLAAGNIVPVIDRRYPLSETAEAIRYLETGRARGKVIITVVEDAT
jgi:NADPH:quinone reductase-like Zn-dependent oxidoreductase